MKQKFSDSIKKDSHQTPAGYGDDQFTLRIEDKVTPLHTLHLIPFHFNFFIFLNKNKKPIINKVNT